MTESKIKEFWIDEMTESKLDYYKLFNAYEECRADNSAHFRKIMQLQKENDSFKRRVEELEQEIRRIQNDVIMNQDNELELLKRKLDVALKALDKIIPDHYTSEYIREIDRESFIENAEMDIEIKQEALKEIEAMK